MSAKCFGKTSGLTPHMGKTLPQDLTDLHLHKIDQMTISQDLNVGHDNEGCLEDKVDQMTLPQGLNVDHDKDGYLNGKVTHLDQITIPNDKKGTHVPFAWKVDQILPLKDPMELTQMT